MNIVVDAANILQIPAGMLIRVLHIDLTSTASSLYSLRWKSTQLVRILKHAITFTCQKCDIIKFRKSPSEEPNSANYGMP